MRRRGLSLLELVAAVAILAVVGAVTLVHFKRAEGRAGARGMAEVLAEELRAARRSAMAHGYPVAVAFPSDGGGRPCSRSFYLLQGQQSAVLSRVRALEGQHSEAVIFAGSWAGFDATPNTTTGDVTDDFDSVSWLGPGFSDPALIFSATGRVRASGLPTYNGNYQLFAAQDVEHTGLTAVSAAGPYLITVTSLGEVFVSQGVPGLAQSAPGQPPVVAVPPSMAAGGNTPPTIADLVLLPVANANVYGPDVYGVAETLAQMYPEQHNTDAMSDYAPITVRVTATDVDGDALSYRMRAEPNEGDFSVVGDADGWSPMSWNPTARHWEADATFLAPAGAGSGDTWTMVAEVSDGDSVVDSNGAGIARQVRRAHGQGKIAFDKRLFTDASGDWQDAVYIMNLDGTGIVKITDVPGVNENNPDWSPGGAWLAFNSTVGGNAGRADVWLCTGDGNYRYNLTDTPGIDEQYPVFSPDGNRLVYLRDTNDDGVYGIFVQNVRPGSTAYALAHSVTHKRYPATWDPTGEYVCYLENTPNGHSLVVDKAEGSVSKHRRIDAEDPGQQGSPVDGNGLTWNIKEAHWAGRNRGPHGSILMRADRDGNGSCGLYLVAVNPEDPYDVSDPLWNPDTDVNPPVELLSENQEVVSCSWAQGAGKIAAVCQPDGSGRFKLKVLFLDFTGTWPPNITSVEQMAPGFNNFKPRFSSGGGQIIVQSSDALDVPYALYRVNISSQSLHLLTEESRDVISHSVTR